MLADNPPNCIYGLTLDPIFQIALGLLHHGHYGSLIGMLQNEGRRITSPWCLVGLIVSYSSQ